MLKRKRSNSTATVSRTSKECVIAEYPEARITRIDDAYWIIPSQVYTKPLGRGFTATEAWNNAYNHIFKD